MTAHVCGAFTGKKLVACCLCCSQPVYDVLEVFADGPRRGEPRRVGLMQPHGCQLEILLSDGSICHIDMCVDCATHCKPEHLWDVWQRNVDRVDELAQLAGRREPQRRMLVRAATRLYPVGVLKWRRQDRELVGAVPDGLVIDHRRPVPVVAAAPPPRRRKARHAH